MTVVVVPTWLVVSVLMSLLTAGIARQKGLSFVGWFAWSLLGWAVTLPLVLVERQGGGPRFSERTTILGGVAVGALWGIVLIVAWEAAR